MFLLIVFSDEKENNRYAYINEYVIDQNETEMDISKKQCLSLLDLPNEMLLLIMKQLNMVDVLYSLVDVTQRLDELVLNSKFTRTLDMTCLKTESFLNRVYSIDDHVLERICKDVLPRLNDQVNELIIDQHSIKRVLHGSDYHQLVSLSLMDLDETFFVDFFPSK